MSCREEPRTPPAHSFEEKTMADRREYYKQWRAENPKRVKELNKVKNEVHKKRYATDPKFNAHWKRVSALSRYKITPAEYDAQLEEQGGHCALCPTEKQVHSLHVDHDHKCCDKTQTCGKCKRGILCTNCNIKLSHLEATLAEALVTPFPAFIGTPESWTERAMRYLKKWTVYYTERRGDGYEMHSKRCSFGLTDIGGPGCICTRRTQCSNDFIASSPELRDAHLLGRTGQSAVWTQTTKGIINQ